MMILDGKEVQRTAMRVPENRYPTNTVMDGPGLHRSVRDTGATSSKINLEGYYCTGKEH